MTFLFRNYAMHDILSTPTKQCIRNNLTIANTALLMASLLIHLIILYTLSNDPLLYLYLS